MMNGYTGIAAALPPAFSLRQNLDRHVAPVMCIRAR